MVIHGKQDKVLKIYGVYFLSVFICIYCFSGKLEILIRIAVRKYLFSEFTVDLAEGFILLPHEQYL